MTIQATTNINEIKLYNVTGQLVMDQIVNANKIEINTSGLNTGIYSLKAILDNGTVIKKVVVQ
jgi:hypothetical protein